MALMTQEQFASPQINGQRSQTVLREGTQLPKLGSFVIDNPKDQELTAREKLWNYHQQHRGVSLRIRNNLNLKSKRSKLLTYSETQENQNEEEEKYPVETKTAKQRFQRTNQKPKCETRGSANLPVVFKRNVGSVTCESPSFTKKDKAITQSVNSNKRTGIKSLTPYLSLTKLGYMKVKGNVIHYGGGFFGRHSTNGIPELHRAHTTINTEFRDIGVRFDTREVSSSREREKDVAELSRKLTYLESLPLIKTEFVHSNTPIERSKPENLFLEPDFHTPRWTSSRENYEGKRAVSVHARRKEDKMKRRLECSDALNRNVQPPAPIITKQSLEERKTKEQPESRHKKVTFKDNPTSKCVVVPSPVQRSLTDSGTRCDFAKENLNIVDKGIKKTEMKPLARSTSDQSIDLPKDKYGPTTHSKFNGNSNVRGSTYAWTNKVHLSMDDEHWVNNALESVDVVDDTVYDTFARTKRVRFHQSSGSPASTSYQYRQNTTL